MFKITTKIGILFIKFYQTCISPIFPSCCRYYPTCSEYGRVAIERFGIIKGSYLTLKRIIRCRPGGGCGYDPVPDIRGI